MICLTYLQFFLAIVGGSIIAQVIVYAAACAWSSWQYRKYVKRGMPS